MPDAASPISRLTGGDRKFELRLTAVGDRYEFVIDGRRIFYGPMHPEAANLKPAYSLLIQAVGTKGELTNIHWRTAPAQQD